ncbi:hypothetical protein SAICODRAFT_136108 [Saitoella complicata NRRL Y-17804]|uniref:C2H2-type domain-containing protein n=1 Tax=Saitoella complicata (strain BCRC 22490 / CBS 7301 / JCM 7358 / NBRC 10748 / NRRL Y-17804) TaxID=698492 RepID=A0A0E9NQD0_SAICN|nr:uncharacterized protein SAICODRAFT_136108 [Saitoella complicata NRRL Y-17804]ODQ52058.1 hypothetical protein SAICODRAFT_136108 [Saitoella complicata NRRL Y-17804]GAO51635.1 hypothetical protein G7K_5730-t1 [Saitoella complicata NRRL Y-17804]
MALLRPSEQHRYAELLASSKSAAAMDYDEAHAYIARFLAATPSLHALGAHLAAQFSCPIAAVSWTPTPRTLSSVVELLSEGEHLGTPRSGLGYDDAHKWVSDFLRRVPSEEGLRVTAKNLWKIDLPAFTQTHTLIPEGVTEHNVAESILLAANRHPDRKMNDVMSGTSKEFAVEIVSGAGTPVPATKEKDREGRETSPTKSALSTVADSLMSGARKFLGFGQTKSPAKEHADPDDEIVEISPGPKRTSSTSQAKKRRASKKFSVWTCGWMGCAAELHDRPTLEKHVKSQHGLEAPSGGFPCVWQGGCSDKMIEFESRPEILEHIQKEHLDPMRWACGVCTGLTFARKEEFDRHEADFHPDISDPEDDNGETHAIRRKRRKTGRSSLSSPLYTTPLAKPGPKGWTPKPPPGYSMPETLTGSGRRKGERTREEEEVGKRSIVDRKTSGWIDSEDEEEVKVQRLAFEGPDVTLVVGRKRARRARELVPADSYRAKIARAAEEDMRVIKGVAGKAKDGSVTPEEGGNRVKWARWLSYVKR